MDISLLNILGIVLAIALFITLFNRKKITKSTPSFAINKDIATKYDFNVKYQSEKPIKIQQLYLYPCRGIRGIEVDALKLSKFGIKYDREWGIFDKDTLNPITQAAEVKYTVLRQKISKCPITRKKYLVISVIPGHEDIVAKLPSKELKICINDTPKGEIIDTGKVQGVYEGLEAEKWFTAFLDTPVIVLRSAPGFTKGLVPALKWQKIDDKSKSFVSKAALHIINLASIRDLTKRVMEKYPDEKVRQQIIIDHYTFRPSILIDTGIPYEEDTVKESRIGNAFIRLVGFCSRCKATANNYDTLDRNLEMEPYTTITEYRKHQLGQLFGTYNQVDIIPSQEQYEALLPDYPPIKDRAFDSTYAIIKKGDELRYRVFQKFVEFSQ